MTNPANPVAPVVPLDTTLESLKKTLEAPPVEGPSMETLTQRFQALMAQPDHHVDVSHGPNVVTSLLSKQEDLLRHIEQQAQTLKEAGPHMTAAELAAASSEMGRTVSLSNFKMTATTSLAQASNKSLQSLLKNS